VTTPDPIPKYTNWAKIPAGLYTRTQLGKLDPPRRICKDATVRGRALYHGNQYADLYALDDTEVKPAPSEKQVAAARRAGELRYVCRWCGHTDEYDPLPQRICKPCGYTVQAYGRHLEGRAHLAGLHQREWRPLFAAVAYGADRDWPTRLVIVDPGLDGAVIADRDMPAVGRDENGWTVTADRHAWNAAAETGPDRRPTMTWDMGGVGALQSVRWDYQRWLGYRGTAPQETFVMPGATGDLAADARALAALVASVVDGTRVPPEPCWASRGLTPVQMRPYVLGYTTREVLALVDRLDALR